MTTGCDADAGWSSHQCGRWIVGDAGRQLEIVPVPAEVAPGRPDTTFDGAQVLDVEYRAVSLRGLSHAASGKPRQDSYLLRVSANKRWLVGCVADGVSAGKYSHIAADVACREITRELAGALAGQPSLTSPAEWKELVENLPWQRAVDQASAAIVARAQEGMPPRQPSGAVPDAREVRGSMATTAVAFATAVTRTPDGLLPYAVAVASGDSSALLLANGRWHPVTAVKDMDSDLASNAVLALPREVEVVPLGGFLRPGEALMVVSDGIGDPLGQGTGAVGRFLAERWSRPPDLFAFASEAAFYRRGFTDDRTAVGVWHRMLPGQEHAIVPSGDGTAEAAPETAVPEGETRFPGGDGNWGDEEGAWLSAKPCCRDPRSAA